jgi:hypothetical protein
MNATVKTQTGEKFACDVSISLPLCGPLNGQNQNLFFPSAAGVDLTKNSNNTVGLDRTFKFI